MVARGDTRLADALGLVKVSATRTRNLACESRWVSVRLLVRAVAPSAFLRSKFTLNARVFTSSARKLRPSVEPSRTLLLTLSITQVIGRSCYGINSTAFTVIQLARAFSAIASALSVDPLLLAAHSINWEAIISLKFNLKPIVSVWAGCRVVNAFFDHNIEVFNSVESCDGQDECPFIQLN